MRKALSLLVTIGAVATVIGTVKGTVSDAGGVITENSIVRLKNGAFKGYLSSESQMAWQDGGQVVSVCPQAHGEDSETDALTLSWIVRSMTPEKSGSAIPCNSTVELEHAQSNKLLTASFQKHSPLSINHQITTTARHETGKEAKVDPASESVSERKVFRVECANPTDKLWRTQTLVTFVDPLSSKPLAALPTSRYDQSNCHRCPIQGHAEVALLKAKISPKNKQRSRQTQWTASPLLALALDDDFIETPDDRKDEL